MNDSFSDGHDFTQENLEPKLFNENPEVDRLFERTGSSMDALFPNEKVSKKRSCFSCCVASKIGPMELIVWRKFRISK